MHSIQAKSHATRAVRSCSVHCPVLSVFFISVFPSTYLFAPPIFCCIYIYTFYFIFYIFFVIVLPLLCTPLKLYVVSFVRVHVLPTSTITLFSWEFIFIIMSDKNLPTEFDSASRSRTTRSRSSRSSRSSHSSHTSRESTDTLVEVAALKVKLQYRDKEAKQKAELDKNQDRNEASNGPSQIGSSRDCTGFC